MKKSYIMFIVLGIILIGGYIIWYLASPLFINKIVDEPVLTDETVTYDFDIDLISSGNFIDADNFHKSSGSAKIVEYSNGKKFLVFEDFKTTNGPDLYIYLSNDLEATDYKILGELKGNIGNQQYEIPEDVNTQDYKYVLIWCKQFGVLFGSAEMN